MTTFKVEKVDSRWMAIGYTNEGDEVWCDGCCLKEKRIVQSIRRNMIAAYQQGLKDALRVIQGRKNKRHDD